MKLAPILLAVVAAPVLDGPVRPECDALTEFAADPAAREIQRPFAAFRIDRAGLCDILASYHEVSADQWRHQYSHVAFADRTGTVTLHDGRVLVWMARPGGLATLTYPDGAVLYLARE
ncbi:MAG: hypothetical protein LKM32_10730 [Chiayiivirga sp.]|uniref:hypothetical protein n=1 Tax=Chiayiivirga sp. TaxID=2041042 RepID=UPI0025C6CAA4|nr:hypothetical protein [Chiayiivirga sp.]MCI1709861.1 hypothetical protein [Chiayiivirga sp.]MCI1729826.1 hypothetical protein [Chiayiivirga sp.]